MIKFKYSGVQDNEKFDMAFNKKRADDRKVWIDNLNVEETWLDTTSGAVTYKDFIDKELILFSN